MERGRPRVFDEQRALDAALALLKHVDLRQRLAQLDCPTAWLFGEHPYGTPIGGDEASLADIRHRDLLGFYEGFIGAERLVVAVVGDIDAASVSVDAPSGRICGRREYVPQATVRNMGDTPQSFDVKFVIDCDHVIGSGCECCGRDRSDIVGGGRRRSAGCRADDRRPGRRTSRQRRPGRSRGRRRRRKAIAAAATASRSQKGGSMPSSGQSCHQHGGRKHHGGGSRGGGRAVQGQS